MSGTLAFSIQTPMELACIAESEELSKITGKDMLFPVQMLILEAGNNALAISEKGSEIQVICTAEAITVSVADHGPGFCYPATLEKQRRHLNVNPLSTSGRGLLLIDALADEVVYTDQQKLVMRVFHQTPAKI